MGVVVYFFGGGFAFFVGATFILLAIILELERCGRWSRGSSITAILGMILVVLSAVPLPIWVYAVLFASTLALLIAQHWRRTIPPRWMTTARVCIAGMWVGAVAFELSYQFVPHVSTAPQPRLYLFGDSVSAGVSDDQTKNWPNLFAKDHSIEVLNYSAAGATLAVANQRASENPIGDGIVLLEIGGNDLLGTTTDQDFNRNLEELLRHVCRSDRQVLMFELPLPPFRAEYGRIQRRLAGKYNVALIPKRIFASVLTGDGATLDSIHLSKRGQQRMADAVWRVLRPAYVKQL
jgi:acyl-CoA thioesterase-1